MFFKTWAKRVWNIPGLLKLELSRLSKRNVISGVMTVISPRSELVGKLHNLVLGDYVSLGRVHIALHGKVIVGSNSVINDGVKILTASHDINHVGWRQFSNDINVGSFVWIASNAIILPGVTIGDYAVIGAGAVVSKDVPAYGVVVGNPGTLIKSRKSLDFKYRPTSFLAPFEAWLGS